MSDKHLYDLYENEPLPEGEEAAPPYAHTMAVIRWAILGGLTIFALVMFLTAFGFAPWANAGSGAVQYHCPMHPTYISNQPGECPICGMTLVPIDSKSGDTKTIKDTAAAPSSHATEQPAEQPAEITKAKPGQYTCPMHPEVVSDKPGRCPICNMKLVQIKGDSTATEDPPPASSGDPMPGMDMSDKNETPSVMDEESNVPGLVEVTIEPERLQLIGLTTGKVEERAPESNLHLVGFIAPDETKLSNIHIRTSGWVSQLFVDQTGQFVKKGELLLSLYSQDLYQAEQDYLLAREGASQKSNDEALNDTRQQLLSAARQRLHLLGLPDDEISQLEKTSAPTPDLALRSPFSGFVMEKNVYSGQYVSADQNLFSIADLSKVYLIAEVYEQDISGVHIGQEADMRLTAFPGQIFRGKVGFIYPAISNPSRTLQIRLEFPNPDLRLRPGMYAEIDLAGGSGKILTAPADAIIDAGDMQYAFVMHDKIHFQPRLVKVGHQYDNWVEILSGLSAGDEVVTNANFLIDSESRLKAAIVGMNAGQATTHSGHTN
ncbi:Efflux transporter, RND family, MFP subunit [Candidatus Zixiibacteriota bacterium]|nr:Efflux transporter, RND family, MFP subunit [candidate division Zixibacteria bacterium]